MAWLISAYLRRRRIRQEMRAFLAAVFRSDYAGE